MNGSQLIREARTVRPDIPAIIITGFMSSEADNGGEEMLANEVLIKPFFSDKLDNAIRKVLNKKLGSE